MSLQSTFDACVKHLVHRAACPIGESYAAKAIVLEFLTIKKSMDPRVWKTEVLDIAADYELDTENAMLAWETSHTSTIKKAEQP